MAPQFDKVKLYRFLNTILKLISTNKNLTDMYDALLHPDGDVEKLRLFISEQDTLGQQLLFLELDRFTYNLPVFPKIFFLSLLLSFNPKPEYFNQLLEIALTDDTIEVTTKYFILYQCISIGFTSHKVKNEKTSSLIMALYYKIYGVYFEQLKSAFTFIPKEKREKKLIFVMIAQFINLNHGPTKTALDRCMSLQELGYEVLLINTCEFLSSGGLIPFYGLVQANVNKELQSYNSVDFNNHVVPYYQASNMPSLEGIINILLIVQEYRPYMIFNIGSYNLTADLCSNFVPVATVTTVPSSLPTTKSQFHITGREITPNDIEHMERNGFGKENLISSTFTFTFKPQLYHYTREDLGLPEDKFLLVLVGGRLSKEVSNEFIDLLLQTTSVANTHLVFVGLFEQFEQVASHNELFKKNATNLGMQDDVLAVLECCDLYINPRRVGGGTSSIEALYKGVPVVTYKNGDVYTCAGDEFGIDNEDAMVEIINRYSNDKKFYKIMSQKSIEKANMLVDSKGKLESLIKTIESSILFQ
ncbi:MAG: glycosyltransferase [Arcobacteraceae bacterium]|jgi:glycosyltransferase involved in cell wall biosynthesis|nr:glycosyltransferase [Arcobacteraceae bacterium]